MKRMKQAFDWHGAPLSLNTRITDDYRNTQNVRRFFRSQLGDDFHFTVEFIGWMKQNPGKTLKAAVLEWQRRYQRRSA
jgi:hypothetical protein